MNYSLLQPALRWEDAIPTGNGPLGVLVHGHLAQDSILINHDRCWLEKSRPELPDLAHLLPEVRRLQSEGLWKEAAKIYPAALKDAGYHCPVADYHPLGELWVHHPDLGINSGWKSALDHHTGEILIQWRQADRPHERRLFVSRADDVIVMSTRGWLPGGLRLDCRLRPYRIETVTDFGSGRVPHWPKPPIDWRSEQGAGWHAHIGSYKDGREFGAVLQIIPLGGGKIREDNYWGGSWSGVDEAEAALVLVKCWHGEPATDAIHRLRSELAALPADYDTLFSRHRALHAPLVDSFTLELGGTDSDRAKSNDALIQEAFEGRVVPALIERMVAHQRHLLICSTRTGSWPANLQGRWNGDYAPAWQSDYHNDINVQMNYWPAPLSGLAHFIEPLVDYYFQFMDDYRRNARQLFGCRGILLPTMMAAHGQVKHSDFIHWTAGAGWMAQHWWEHWLVTGDRSFLQRRTLPWLRETAAFYLDFIQIRNGIAHFTPSISPENRPPGMPMVVADATMDVAVCREVLRHLLEALRVLGERDPEEPRYRTLLAALPPYQTNTRGGLKEWLHPALHDNEDHRHLSHLYGLFPGCELNAEDTPETFRLAASALDQRQSQLGSMAGWSFSFMACTAARLGRGDTALENLQLLLQTCTTPNLFTWHNDWRSMGMSLFWGHGALPPFQIEAGLGFVAAVCEMLLHSRPGFLHLLPALPAAWPEGRVRGLTTRCGVTLDLEWRDGGRVIKASLHSRDTLRITLRLPALFMPERRIVELSPGPNIHEFRVN